MKRLHVSQDIVPIGEFKVHASRILRELRKGQRPLVITQHGKSAAVVLTPKEFDRLIGRERFQSAVREGLANADAGRVVPDEDLTEELDPTLGPLKPARASRSLPCTRSTQRSAGGRREAPSP